MNVSHRERTQLALWIPEPFTLSCRPAQVHRRWLPPLTICAVDFEDTSWRLQHSIPQDIVQRLIFESHGNHGVRLMRPPGPISGFHNYGCREIHDSGDRGRNLFFVLGRRCRASEAMILFTCLFALDCSILLLSDQVRGDAIRGVVCQKDHRTKRSYHKTKGDAARTWHGWSVCLFSRSFKVFYSHIAPYLYEQWTYNPTRVLVFASVLTP